MPTSLEGMTREARRRTIIEHWMDSDSFHEPSLPSYPEESKHMWKRQDIMKLCSSVPEFEGNAVHSKQLVEALLWYNRDISRFRGRPLSLLDRILRRYDAGAENVWSNISAIVDHIRSCTVYVHIGGKTVVRVLGGPTKMYISEVNDFYDIREYNDYDEVDEEQELGTGYFLENYYLRENGYTNRDFTLNIVERDLRHHFDVVNIETAIAFMLTRHMGERCAEVMHGVWLCEQVTSLISSVAKIGGSLVPTGVEMKCPKHEILSRLLQTFEVKEDFALKHDGEAIIFHRLSSLNHEKLLSNIGWLSEAEIPSRKIYMGDGELPASYSRKTTEFRFYGKSVYRRCIIRTALFSLLFIALVSVSTWASLGQDIDAAEKAEKWLTLALFGCIAVALSLVGSDRRRDLLRDLFFFRRQMFSSTKMDQDQRFFFLMEISKDVVQRRECLNQKNANWLGRGIDGSFEFSRPLSTREVPGSRLLLRQNGDITFSWGGSLKRTSRVNERIVNLSQSGILDIGRDAGPVSGIEIDCDATLA